MAANTCARSRSPFVRLALGALLCTASIILFAVSPAAAAWSHDAANNLLVASAGFHENPVIIPDGSGGAIITWQQNDGGAALKDIYAEHVLVTGVCDPAWPVNGRPISSAVNQQQDPKLVSDGAGGAIIVWEDLRSNTSFDLYAQHVLATGVVDPAWPVDGRAIAVAAGDQFAPAITTDGVGGAIIAWRDARNGVDDDVFVQRITIAGNVAFAANGINLTAGQPGNQNSVSICADGVGGAFIAWTDGRTSATTQNDIYVQRITNTGSAYSTPGGKAVCTDTQEQDSPVVVQDATGGCLIVWADKRTGANFDIYAARMDAYLEVEWAANGVAVCSAALDQTVPVIVADGQGGAQIAWQDLRLGGYTHIYAQHLLYSGIQDPAAPVDGRALCVANYSQFTPVIASDGSGGAIAAWKDFRGLYGWSDIYAGHILASGVIDPVWPVNGRAISIAANNQYVQTICADLSGGAIVTWEDSRTATNSLDIYAQRADRFGYLGSPEAFIEAVSDVPADQGGKVKLSWDASYLDLSSDPNLSSYDVYRSVPPFTAAQRIAAGARVSASPLGATENGQRPLLTTFSNTATYYWEYQSTVNAQHFLPGYSYLASTSSDSTGAANPRTWFMVVARNTSGSYYWLSAPDSGYSADNLPPFTPAPFTGQYSAGATHLHWNPNTDADLANYRLYRGTTAGFVPGPSNVIATPPDTGFVDPGGAGRYYKLSAVDVHGNESGFAALTPGTTLAVDGDAGLSFALSGLRPNPTRGGRMNVEFVLAVASPARLDLLDVAGRLVATRDVGSFGAGRHAIDLVAGAHLAPGIYLVRLSQGTNVLTKRAVVLE